MIIGLTGRMAAGKGTVADLLREMGFEYHSLSDAIRAELKTRDLPETRANLTDVGNLLRREYGPGALAHRILPECDRGKRHIVDSIRNPVEVDVLQESDWPFILLCVDASAEVRYERLRERGRVGDVDSFEAFVAQENRELVSADPRTQQLIATEAKAEHRLVNDGSIGELRHSFEALMKSLGL